MIDNLHKKHLLRKNRVLTYADFTQTKEADIEDMFDEDFYLAMVNGALTDALSKPVTKGDLNQNVPRIAKRLEAYFEANPLADGQSFNHFRTARYFLDRIGRDVPSSATLTRFEEAFVALNKLVKS